MALPGSSCIDCLQFWLQRRFRVHFVCVHVAQGVILLANYLLKLACSNVGGTFVCVKMWTSFDPLSGSGALPNLSLVLLFDYWPGPKSAGTVTRRV